MNVSKALNKKAFTLIELLIVIIIMGVVYNLAITNFAKLSKGDTKVSLSNLRSYLASIPHDKSVKLLCFDECQACDIYVDDVKSRTIEGLLNKDVRSYRYEFNYGYTEAEKDVFFDDNDVEKDICFSYKVDKKGVGDQILVEFKNKFYDLGSYIKKTPVYSSLDDAQEVKDNLAKEVMR